MLGKDRKWVTRDPSQRIPGSQSARYCSSRGQHQPGSFETGHGGENEQNTRHAETTISLTRFKRMPRTNYVDLTAAMQEGGRGWLNGGFMYFICFYSGLIILWNVISLT